MPAAVAAEQLPDGVASALFVNLLTEDNLPYYFAAIDKLFGRDGAWGYWTRRWTAEEGRHSIVLRDYLTMSGYLDPVTLERARMAQVTGGVSPDADSIVDAFAYLALQELATRIAHHNTGKALPDAEGHAVMKRVAADENLHYLFYRDLVSAAFEIDPSTMMEAVKRQVIGFEMPGTGIPGLRPARPGHRPGRHLRLRGPPRRHPAAGGARSLGGGRPPGPHPGGRGGARRAPALHLAHGEGVEPAQADRRPARAGAGRVGAPLTAASGKPSDQAVATVGPVIEGTGRDRS